MSTYVLDNRHLNGNDNGGGINFRLSSPRDTPVVLESFDERNEPGYITYATSEMDW